MSECKTCVHDGNQMIFISGCTGCGDSEFLNYEPSSEPVRPFNKNEAAYHLKNNRLQIDSEGVMVGVSRKALDDVLSELAILRNRVHFLRNKP